MQLGRNTEKIVLQRLEDFNDARSGALSKRVASSSVVWAESKPTRGGAVAQGAAGGEVIPGLVSFIIRYRDGIDPINYRVKDHDGMLWNIVDLPKMIGRKQGLELICQWTGKRYIEGVGVVDVTSMLMGGATHG